MTVATCLTDLCLLADKYGTDKLGVYTHFYDLLLGPRRANTFKVLEVGIGTPDAMKHVNGYVPGASLRMWRDYFPCADIYGLDINAAAVENARRERITTFQCDQASEADLEAVLPKLLLGGKFDLIIDDGSHKPEDQLLAFKVLSRALDRRGLYVIEDVNPPATGVSWYLPENTLVETHSGNAAGRLILIRGEVI